MQADTSQHSVGGHTHHDHLIGLLVVTTIFLLQADALGGTLRVGVICRLLLVLLATVPERATVQARYWVVLIARRGSLNQGHEVPDLDEEGLLFNLSILIELAVLAHREQELVPRVHHLLNVVRFVVDHERRLRVVHGHIFGQVEEFTEHDAFLVVFSCEEQEVVVQEDHAYDFDEGV